MRHRLVLRYIGIILLFNAAFLLLSAIVSAVYSDSAFSPLLYSFIVSALAGLLPILFIPPSPDISNREALNIVVAGWFLTCLIGSMPYILWGGEFSVTNAWFESVSGFTTTGSSILTDIEALPPGLLFWRSATHWIGGIGIIIFVLSVLPYIGNAGRILYRTEMSSLAMENFHYRSKTALKILVYVYVGLTVLEVCALLLCGMNLFDAVTHAFGTIATGGFSPKNISIQYYHSFSVELVVIIFMLLSGIHFGLLFSAISGKISELWRSPIVRYYLLSMTAGIVLTTVSVHGNQYQRWGEALRYSAFQITSLGTSTGFSTADSSVWPPFAQLIMIFFTLQCACAGSTSGGIKSDRMVLFWKALRRRIKKIKHPHAVIDARLGNIRIDDDLLEATVTYIVLYVSIVFASSILLTALGVDSLTAISGSAATMGNVGPGFGNVGSMGNFSHIPDPGKWILSATMLLGRLEIFGLFLFFMVKSRN